MAAMITVSAAEVERDLGRYQELALSRPVAISRDGREDTVMISTGEYERLKRRDREVLTLGDFTDEDLAAIEAAEPPESSKQYDHEWQSER